VVQRGPNLLRWSAADFYARAWQEPARHNSLESGDLILRAEVPNQGRRSAYLQVSEKHEFDWALASCAAAAKVADGKISRARIALGCISPTVHQAQAAHDFLEGKVLDETVAAQAAELVLASARAQTQNAYKIPITHALIRRTLLKLKG
jgi:xanthine dehydrogenase YagS FAD-binding subunit